MSDLKRMFRNKVAEYKKRYDDYSKAKFEERMERQYWDDIEFREQAYKRVAERQRNADKLNCGKGLFLSDVLYKK